MIYVVTGNKNKRKEIKKFLSNKNVKFFDLDLREIYTDTPELIVIYKLLEATKFINNQSNDLVVEDITMEVNGEFIPDIKWKQNELKNNDKVKIILTIGVAKNQIAKIYQKTIEGVVKKDICKKYEFGFDNIVFIGNQCLGDYKRKHPLRDLYKEIFNENKIKLTYNLNDLPKWTGNYQNEKE